MKISRRSINYSSHQPLKVQLLSNFDWTGEPIFRPASAIGVDHLSRNVCEQGGRPVQNMDAMPHPTKEGVFKVLQVDPDVLSVGHLSVPVFQLDAHNFHHRVHDFASSLVTEL